MKELITSITIDAPPAVVWNILTDFDAYPAWNPFILSFGGKPAAGERFSVTIRQPGSKPMTFKPVCLKMDENREFRWLGHLLFMGLFDGEHIFELEPLPDGGTKLVQRERFSGILVPLLWKQLDTSARQGFEMMNEKLKERAEGMDT
ncbi:MAG: SRPBCC domain-containing protein [Balneolaceae bacterium]|nr:MAG: SRPBCC domain-containing protein [Balneolaceae bacterium]